MNAENANSDSLKQQTAGRQRITSIDAVRGLVVFTMIFVNDLAGAPTKIVPDWMRHFHGKSGMTFVDLVFPGFLFIVGMSIPFALGGRFKNGIPLWKTFVHVFIRTLALLFIGILMVNEVPDTVKMGWSGTLWCVLMYLCAILAFSTFVRKKTSASGEANNLLTVLFRFVRIVGLIGLVILALLFRGEDGHRIVNFSPFSIYTSWYGILGLIGWAYFEAALIYIAFRNHRLALLACMVLLFCFYPAEQTGVFGDFWLDKIVGIGGTLGSQAAITVAGMFLATILVTPETSENKVRAGFTFWFIGACAAGALLLHGLYGINKNEATPSWCLWACGITAAFWLVFYYLCDIHPVRAVSQPFRLAGQNVLLAYLLSEMLPSLIDLLGLGNWYGAISESCLTGAIGRSVGCSVLLLCVTAVLNRLGFWLKL